MFLALSSIFHFHYWWNHVRSKPISPKATSPTCNYIDLQGPFISFFTLFTKVYQGYSFYAVMHIHCLVRKQLSNIIWWASAGRQCAGKKSVEESLCNLPSKTFTLLIFSSHQCICSSLMSVIFITLDTTFRSIRPINISISSFGFNLLFLKHFRTRRRSLSFIFFCAVCVRDAQYYNWDNKRFIPWHLCSKIGKTLFTTFNFSSIL